jgi:quercetin dioxygenase-like cupin family protein
MRNRQLTFLVAAAVAGTTVAATAIATPSTGVLAGPVLARASYLNQVNLMFMTKLGPKDYETVRVRRARETVVQQIVFSPGGQTGWHSHPGPVVVLIKTGTMTFYDGNDPTCSARTYTAGQAFVDSGQGHVHIARNESVSENLELWATYFDVPVGGLFRDDVAAPGNCAF